MGAKAQAFLFTWRDAFCSPSGPPSATRHVLWSLSRYMDKNGRGAFPSISTLAQRTDYSERTVGKCLKLAESQGWILRTRWRDKGKNWARHRYQATLPTNSLGPEPSSGAIAEGKEVRVSGQEWQNSLVRNVVPTMSLGNSLNNSPAIPLTSFQASKGYEVFREKMKKLVHKKRWR